ncbi:MAG: RimJ/RimL family protein N-acetyltransferase [Verrucomicrobiales bacterium]
MTKPLSESIADVCDRTDPYAGYRIRPWNHQDATVLVAAWNDPEIARWNPVPSSPNLHLAESWIEGTATQNIASIGIDVVLVSRAPPSLVIGEIGLQVDPVQEIAEIGFWVSEEYRGTGVGVPLLTLARSLAATLELHGLVALTDAKNEKAIALLQSSGWNEVPTTTERRAFAVRSQASPRAGGRGTVRR